MARSSSSVSTPSASAVENAVSVFSGARPRAPRWPCRSKADAPVASATMLVANANAMGRVVIVRLLRLLDVAYRPPSMDGHRVSAMTSAVQQLGSALPEEADRDEEHHPIGDAVKHFRRRDAYQPDAEEVAGDRERQKHRRGRE